MVADMSNRTQKGLEGLSDKVGDDGDHEADEWQQIGFLANRVLSVALGKKRPRETRGDGLSGQFASAAREEKATGWGEKVGSPDLSVACVRHGVSEVTGDPHRDGSSAVVDRTAQKSWMLPVNR